MVSFLKSFIRERVGDEGEEGMRKFFATWSSYRMRKVHVELIGKKEIYRPNSTLKGIDGGHRAGAEKGGGVSLDGRRGEPNSLAGGGQSDTYGKADRG